jgi:hypothetical protein
MFVDGSQLTVHGRCSWEERAELAVQPLSLENI